MLITFSVFIAAIFHVPDMLVKTLNGKHAAVRGGRAWQERLKPEPGEGALQSQLEPSSQVRHSQRHCRVSQITSLFTGEETVKAFALSLHSDKCLPRSTTHYCGYFVSQKATVILGKVLQTTFT